MQIFASASFKNVVVSFGIIGRIEPMPMQSVLMAQIQTDIIATQLSSAQIVRKPAPFR